MPGRELTSKPSMHEHRRSVLGVGAAISSAFCVQAVYARQAGSPLAGSVVVNRWSSSQVHV